MTALADSIADALDKQPDPTTVTVTRPACMTMAQAREFAPKVSWWVRRDVAGTFVDLGRRRRPATGPLTVELELELARCDDESQTEPARMCEHCRGES